MAKALRETIMGRFQLDRKYLQTTTQKTFKIKKKKKTFDGVAQKRKKKVVWSSWPKNFNW